MIDWDEAMQLECATSFIKPLQKELMDRTIIHNLIGKITNLMFELEDNDNLVNAWAKVFLIAVPQCNIDFLIDEILPELFPHNSLKEKLNHRILTAELILEIASVYGERAFTKEMKIFEFSWATWEDINWKIRKLGANRLRRIIKKSLKMMKEEKDVYHDILEKLEELMTDEENFVKIDAFETIITWISFFQEKDIKEKLVPIIKNVFEKEVVEHEEFMFPIALLWGELLHTLNQHGVGDLLKSEIVEFYQTMLTHEDKELRKRAVYNLPFFFNEFYKDEEVKTNISDEGEEQKFWGITKEKWDDHVESLIHEELDANQTGTSSSTYTYETDFKSIADLQTMQLDFSQERGLLESIVNCFHEICK
jgi:hypothetical protein